VAALGDLPLSRITPDTLRRYQIERSATMSPASVNAETRVFAGILKENKLWPRLREDFRKLREPKSSGRRLTEAEMESLLQTAEKRRDVSVIFQVMRLQLETGLRHKEVRMLRRKNIDLRRRLLFIEREATKTDSGVRAIPLTQIAELLCVDLLDRAAELGSIEDHHYLFPGIEFKHTNNENRRVHNPAIPQSSFGDAWRTLRRLANVDGALRIHDLRHHFSTDIAEAGVPSAVAMRLMGWSSVEMRQRYEHIQDSSLRFGMDRMTEHRASVRSEQPKKPVKGVVIPFACIKAR